MSTCLPVTYWSDPICIWAFVAQPRLDAIMKAHGTRITLDLRIVPVFGSVPYRFREGNWRDAGPEGRAETTRAVAARHGRTDVSGQVWLDDPPASSWAVCPPIKAAQVLEARGDIPTGSAADYLWRTRVAFFVDNRNVARRSTQLAVAEEAGLPPDALAQLLDDGTAAAALFEDHQSRDQQQIQGSPTWVFDGGRAKLYGNFAEEILHATVEALVSNLEPGGSPCNC
jgi:predicted DsbA family dithiol-disulfide isomerase